MGNQSPNYPIAQSPNHQIPQLPHLSCGEPEVDDVAVLHDVLLALEAHFAVLTARGHRAARDERIVADNLGPDEAAGDVAVNFSGGQLRRGLARDRPGAAFVLADGEKRHVPEQIVSGADNPVEARLAE